MSHGPGQPIVPPAGGRPGAPAGYDVPWAVVADWWLSTYGTPPYDEALARRTYAQALAAWRQYTAAQAEWQTYAAAQAWPGHAAGQPWQSYGQPQSWTGQATAASGAYGYPPGRAVWGGPASSGAPPRRRRGLLATLLIVLLVAGPLATGAAAIVYWSSEGGFGGAVGARVNEGPRPVAGDPFEPTLDQYYYFLDAGTAVEDGRIVRWEQGSVDVAIEGDSTGEDRRAVDEALADIRRTVDWPRFGYSQDDPDIVIRFLDGEEFARLPIDESDAIGWCSSSYSASSYTLTRATISIDDSPEYRSSRSSVIYHEIGHAIGLDDVKRPQWRQTIMYYEVSSPRSYTTADLAAIRMLYDSRLEAGDTERDIRQVFAPK